MRVALACLAVLWSPLVRAELPTLMPLGKAWAANSINTPVYRQDPITTHGDRQFAAYYDAGGNVIVATRTIGQAEWKTNVTELHGDMKDAHRSISLIADGEGYLHICWDHHDNPLHYARSKTPGGTDFEANLSMTGKNEGKVTYPQFYYLADGNLIFCYRDGASGRGNMVVNRYDTKARAWEQMHANLISGENKRNAYWEACVDGKGAMHVAWVWRESPDVATNHDICYARSDDGGKTWKKSDGTAYVLPITAASAEIAATIPPRHELINQTSICTDTDGRPVIATYFRPEGQKVVQYFIVRHDGKTWSTTQVSQRKTPFSLSGAGTKAIPIARPQVVARSVGGKTSVAIIFRDVERDSRVSIAHCADLAGGKWDVADLTDFSVRSWEPSYDHIRWQRDGVLDLFVQMTGQGDAETLEAVSPQTAYVLEWKPQ